MVDSIGLGKVIKPAYSFGALETCSTAPKNGLRFTVTPYSFFKHSFSFHAFSLGQSPAHNKPAVAGEGKKQIDLLPLDIEVKDVHLNEPERS